MREARLSMPGIYAWALFVFASAMVASWCLGRAVQGDDTTGAITLFLCCVTCVLWLLHLRREAAR